MFSWLNSFKVVVWSKLKIEHNKDLNQIKDRIEKRFEILLPIIDMDILIINSL